MISGRCRKYESFAQGKMRSPTFIRPTHMPQTESLQRPDAYLIVGIRTMLPPVPDIVKLPVVAVERDVRELPEVRQVAAVALVSSPSATPPR